MGITPQQKQPDARLVRGAEGPAPQKGCSEIHVGRRTDGVEFLATIEPWHGSMVAVYSDEGERKPASATGAGALDLRPGRFGPRVTIDDTLDDGHALCVADIDGDGGDEIFSGHRGKRHGVAMYKFERESRQWVKTEIDADVAAQDLRSADIDRDGRAEVFTVGGTTQNVIMYRWHRR
jgi:hypothetical protein